jgi:hypothetical protein
MAPHLKFTHHALAAAAWAACAGTSAWSQTATPLGTSAPTAEATPLSDADRQAANQQLMKSWQQQTGQATSLDSVDSAESVEFHGQTSLDVYNNSSSIPSGNPALSSMTQGNFGQLGFQGDLRAKSANDTVTYVQGSLNSTNDRAIQARYATQIGNLQVGRTGNGYQLLAGDVAADFSGLSSGLGLRGALASKEFGGFTATGFAGTVAGSWEALLQRSALDGLPPRNSYLRDVVGVKGDYKLSAELTGYATLQNYRDKINSAPLPPLSPAFDGTIVTAGAKYLSGPLQVATEFARSNKHDQNTNTNDADRAFVLDGTYSFTNIKLRAGYHDIGANFASLASAAAPGIREFYAGTDWTITPQLTWTLDARDAITRLPGGAGQTALATLGNRLAYNVQTIPGLAFGLTNTDTKAKDALGNDSRNDTTQIVATYASPVWTANASAGAGHSRDAVNNAADSNTRQWQLGLGRNWGNASADMPASWTLGLMGTLAAQVQTLVVALTQSRSSTAGLNLVLTSTQWGNVNAGLQMQSTSQPTLGAPDLKTTTLNLDWSKDFNKKWTFKTYVRYNLRNHGDALLQADERTIGVQGVFKW